MSNDANKLKRLKTGAFERRLSLAKASVVAGARFAAGNAGALFASSEDREAKRKQVLSEQAEYLVRELGKLKGSIVKIGQMMALYGEHFLPAEITAALHQLNDDTATLAWPTIESELIRQLGADRFYELDIDHEPLAAASLAQVHRARRKSDGLELIVKVQYPGVASAIDSDLNLVTQMLKMTKAVPQSAEFEEWLDEVRMMMHREVNYREEVATTIRFRDYLKGDERYIVPEIFSEYCTDTVIVMSYERGVPINSQAVLQLPQERRDRIAMASLEICCREVFEWGEMQTDPNFGNYLVRLTDGSTPDQIILLDFGAVRDFPEELITLARKLSKAAFYRDRDMMREAMKGFSFFDNMPENVRDGLTDILFLCIEPFTDLKDAPAEMVTPDGKYMWAKSRLHTRVTTRAAKNAASKHFSVPPKEFMFISRKFMGAYTFMTVIDAHIYARSLLEPHFEKSAV